MFVVHGHYIVTRSPRTPQYTPTSVCVRQRLNLFRIYFVYISIFASGICAAHFFLLLRSRGVLYAVELNTFFFLKVTSKNTGVLLNYSQQQLFCLSFSCAES